MSLRGGSLANDEAISFLRLGLPRNRKAVARNDNVS